MSEDTDSPARTLLKFRDDNAVMAPRIVVFDSQPRRVRPDLLIFNSSQASEGTRRRREKRQTILEGRSVNTDMNVNPYEVPMQAGDMTRAARSSERTLLKVFGIPVILFVLIALLLPATRRAGPVARRTQCKNHLKQIGLALHNYHHEYGRFPPAYTVGEGGECLHSWRTRILPYLDQTRLSESIDLSKAWDDPANVVAYETVVHQYNYPSNAFLPGLTTYLGISDAGGCFRSADSTSISDITDGTSNTIMAIEAAPVDAVHWMDPHDDDGRFVRRWGTEAETAHYGGGNGLLADGGVHFLSSEFSVDNRRALSSFAGNEVIGEYRSLARRRSDWSHPVRNWLIPLMR